MLSQPDTDEVLRTIATFLRDELLSSLEGAPAYRTRVAINLLEILEREARLGPALLARERELLVDLVGGTETDLLTLNKRLVEILDDSPADPELDRRSLAALTEITGGKVDIARPGYREADS